MKKFERSQLSCSPDVVAIFFVACHSKTHNFLQGILMCPGSPHHCVRQRQRHTHTHTHTHPAILQGIFMGGAIPHYCEREKERARDPGVLH